MYVRSGRVPSRDLFQMHPEDDTEEDGLRYLHNAEPRTRDQSLTFQDQSII